MYLDNAASWRGLDYLKDELGCRCKFDSLKVELGIRLRHFRTGSARKVAHFGSWPSMER